MRATRRQSPPPRDLVASGHLDFWASDVEPNDDDDDEPKLPIDDGEVGETQEQRLCPVCQGKGRDKTGAKCSRCNGVGRIKVGDKREDDLETRTFYGDEFEEE